MGDNAGTRRKLIYIYQIYLFRRKINSLKKATYQDKITRDFEESFDIFSNICNPLKQVIIYILNLIVGNREFGNFKSRKTTECPNFDPFREYFKKSVLNFKEFRNPFSFVINIYLSLLNQQ